MSAAAIRLYHHSRCAKSRQALALLRANGSEPEIVEYQSTQLAAEDFARLCDGLGVEPQAIVRFKDELARTLGLSASDQRPRDEWLRWLADHPALMERPIALRVRDGRAVVGRPPEEVLGLLEKGTGEAAGGPPA